VTTSTLTVTEFVSARLDEDEAAARADLDSDAWGNPYSDGTGIEFTFTAEHVLAQCAAMRKIVELHASWPVLAETTPEFEDDASDPMSLTFRITRQIAWVTEQEYRNRFGEEPPTAPMLRALASIWSDHPAWCEEWR
jgi:hypothetical protein